MNVKKPIQHSMARRSAAHDYSRPGIYHVTLHVAEGMGQPLGAVESREDGTVGVKLTAVGAAVERELLTAITAHYPMVAVDAYVVMPEHLHFILMVSGNIVSRNGRATHLGQVIAGFKKGCNRAFWAITGQTPSGAVPNQTPPPPGKPAATVCGGLPAAPPAALAPAALAPAPAASRPPSSGSTGRQPLFAYGYCDVMPIDAEQLETQRAYIKDNPRSRWLRSHDRDRLQTQRGGIDTALSPAALRGFLQRECPPALVASDVLAGIERRLLLADGKVTCDSYGDRALLRHRLLPVVCHRRDSSRFAQQKARCLDEAAHGAVLVSARIAKGEQEIIDEAVRHGFPVALIADNGFPAVYHPSTGRTALCAEGRLLLLTPWQYQYRGKNDQVFVPFCKTMNCVAQALCRLKDDWWRNNI